MTQLKKWLRLVAAAALGSLALAGSAKIVCGLTGEPSDECCCEQQGDKLVCNNTGAMLDACCCKTE
jgi:hypothetical protein